MHEASYSRETTWILLSRVAGYAIALASSVLVARALGVERLGQYAYAMGLAAFFGLLPNFGISTVVTRAVARNPHAAAGIAVAAVRLQAILAVGTAVVIVGFGAILPEQPVPLEFVVLAAGQLALGTVSWPYLAVLGGRAQYGRVALVELLTGTAGLLLLAVVAVAGGGVAEFLWAHVAVAGAAIAVARWMAAPFLFASDAGPCTMGGLLREGLPFSAMAVIQSFYTRLDVVLLGQLSSPLAVGLYSVAYKPVNMMVNVGATASGTLFPFIVQAEGEEGGARLSRVARVFGVAAPAIALALSGLSRPLIEVLYGASYADAAPLLTVLAWSAAAYWLYAPVGIALQARGFERWWLAVLAGGLALNATGNVLTIPRWGASGAAVTMLLSEAALACLGALLAGRLLGVAPSPVALSGIAGSSAAGCAVLWGLQSAGAIAATAAALAVYGGLLLLCRVVTVEDVAKTLGRFREAFVSAPSG